VKIGETYAKIRCNYIIFVLLMLAVTAISCSNGQPAAPVRPVSENSTPGVIQQPVKPAAVYTPPAYADPHLFIEREVTVGDGEWELPGTLTLPTTAGPFAAVILVHGPGPSDRDQSYGPNKPFRDLA
jgi:hypothetical protein